MKRIITFLLLLLLIASFLRPLYAQEQTSAVTMDVPSLSLLTITSSDQTINLLQDASGEAAYEAGYIDGGVNKPSLTVNSNTNWKLQVKVSSDWNLVDSYQKDTADLKLKITSSAGHQTGFTDFTSLSLTDQEIATYTEGVGAEIYNGQYRMLLDWGKDIPGSYTIIVTYTLSTQAL